MSNAAVRRIFNVFVGVAFAFALVVMDAGSAGATYPGKNGKIAFIRRYDNPPTTSSVDPDGSHRKTIRRGYVDEGPSFSADGRRIVLRGHRGIYIARAGGRKVRRIRRAGDAAHSPALSPNGRTIAYLGGDDNLRTIQTDGSHRQRVTDRVHGVGLNGATFSPNGRYVVVGLCDLNRIDLRTGAVKKLYYPGSGQVCAVDPDVSPNGKHIVFEYNHAPDLEIWTVGIDGRHARPLLKSDQLRVGSPVYSPNGKKILFQAPFGHDGDARLMTADSRTGNNRRRLGVNGTEPAWGVRH